MEPWEKVALAALRARGPCELEVVIDVVNDARAEVGLDEWWWEDDEELRSWLDVYFTFMLTVNEA